MIEGSSFTRVRPERKWREIPARAELVEHADIGPEVVHVVVKGEGVLRGSFQELQRHFAGQRVRAAEISFAGAFVVDTVESRHVQ